MIACERRLTLGTETGDVPVDIIVFVPERHAADAEDAAGETWISRVEIHWPDRVRRMVGNGSDTAQALIVALRLVGVMLYTSEAHAAGRLSFLERGLGYGFPVSVTIRDLAVGYDKDPVF